MPTRAVLSWLVLVGVCGLVEFRCAHTSYDYRASKRAGCTQLKDQPVSNESCFQPAPGCLDAITLMTFSPRSLSDVAGMGGPLLTWLPMLLAYRSEAPATSILLARTMIWYLAVISATRHLHMLTGWDPSGHVIVYGSQLAPLWQLWEQLGYSGGEALSEARTLLLCWLLVWASVLCYLSGMTAVAFHTLSETTAAAAMVLILAAWLNQREGRVVDLWHVAAAATAWAVPTALSWMVSATAARSSPPLFGFLVYDLAVWLCFFAVARGPFREGLDFDKT